jgi:hypothetical protein
LFPLRVVFNAFAVSHVFPLHNSPLSGVPIAPRPTCLQQGRHLIVTGPLPFGRFGGLHGLVVRSGGAAVHITGQHAAAPSSLGSPSPALESAAAHHSPGGRRLSVAYPGGELESTSLPRTAAGRGSCSLMQLLRMLRQSTIVPHAGMSGESSGSALGTTSVTGAGWLSVGNPARGMTTYVTGQSFQWAARQAMQEHPEQSTRDSHRQLVGLETAYS